MHQEEVQAQLAILKCCCLRVKHVNSGGSYTSQDKLKDSAPSSFLKNNINFGLFPNFKHQGMCPPPPPPPPPPPQQKVCSYTVLCIVNYL